MATRSIQEGLVELELPEDSRLSLERGPQTAGGGFIFYNPAARDSRDFTVVLLRALPPPEGGWHILDGMAGSGVRGLRVALEVDRVASVVLNDGTERACELAAVQAARNRASHVTVSCRALDAVLSEPGPRFDFIDIDPYGSPLMYFPRAAQRLGRGGHLAATATDLAALCGVFPKACVRRYGAVPLRNEWMKETGTRILLGAIARACASAERAVEPVASFCAQHYVRLFLRVSKGAQAAGRSARNVGFLSTDPKGERSPAVVNLAQLEQGAPMPEGRIVGPLWVGDLHDREVLSRAQVPEWIAKKSAVHRLLRDAPGEVGLPPWFFGLDHAARHLKGSPPPTDVAVDALIDQGFRASRTHMDPKGVKTDASPVDFRRVLGSVGRGRR